MAEAEYNTTGNRPTMQFDGKRQKDKRIAHLTGISASIRKDATNVKKNHK